MPISSAKVLNSPVATDKITTNHQNERGLCMGKYIILLMMLLATLLPTKVAKAEPTKNFFPQSDLPQFLAKNFDLASVRSTFGSKRNRGQSSFITDLYSSPQYTQDAITVSEGGWFYQIKILEIKDENEDGVQDVVICFKDDSIDGNTYYMTTPYLLTRYSHDMPVIALAYFPLHKNCEDTSEDN